MPRTDCTPLEELAAYAASGRIERPEELLRLAKLAVNQVIALVDTHPRLDLSAKARIITQHPQEGRAGLRPLCRLLAHAEESLVEELREAARFPVCQPDESPTSAPVDALAGRA